MTNSNNPFERYDIPHLSASSTNLFIQNLPLWIVRYLVGYKAPTNAAMLRGITIDKMLGEVAVDPKTDLSKIISIGNKYFNESVKDLEDDPEKILNEKNDIYKYLEVGVPFYKQYGKAESYQERVELNFEDIPVPIIGFADLTYEETVRDIKTSARKPSELPDTVQRQLAIYATALEKPRAYADYIVVTKTKQEMWTLQVEDINMRLDEVYNISLAIMNLLHNNDIKSLVDQCYPDFSDWRWDAGSIAEAKKLWSIK